MTVILQESKSHAHRCKLFYTNLVSFSCLPAASSCEAVRVSLTLQESHLTSDISGGQTENIADKHVGVVCRNIERGHLFIITVVVCVCVHYCIHVEVCPK